MNLCWKEIGSNKGVKAKMVVLLFRIVQWGKCGFFRKVLTCPVFIFYKLVVDFMWGVEIPVSCQIGRGLKISHAKNITIHPDVVVGVNLHLRHGVTLGNRVKGGGAPRVGNNVEFGCNSSALGAISIGDGVVVGAHSLVISDVPNNSVVIGVPGKIKF